MLLFFNPYSCSHWGGFSLSRKTNIPTQLTYLQILLYGISCSTYTAHSSIFLLKVSGMCLALVVMEAVRWRIMGSSRNIFWDLESLWWFEVVQMWGRDVMV